MHSNTSISYADAVRRGNHDTMNDMVAPGHDPHRDSLITLVADSASAPVALVNTPSTAHNSDPNSNPYKFWNGVKSTLAPFLEALEITLSAHDSGLYTFAVEYYAMLTNGKTVLVHPGQAAQLDGNLARPVYSWNTPAPEAADQYGVDHVTITQTVVANYHALRLRNPALPDADPVVPMGTTYPVDTNQYMLSAPMMAQHDKRLRAFLLGPEIYFMCKPKLFQK